MKNKNIYKILICILILACISNLTAGPKDKYGLSAGRELLIPVGSISTSLNGANLAAATGLDAIYWNPSGLALLNSKTAEVLFSSQMYIADININYFAGAYKIPNIGTIGLSVNAFGFGEIPVTTVANPQGTGETFSPNFITGGITYARAMTDRITFGTTAKIVYEEISRESATGFALDFGLQYNAVGTGLQFGIALKNLGSNMVFSGPDLEQFFQPPGTPTGTQNEPRSINLQSSEMPTILSLGLTYDFRLDKKNNLIAHGTFQNNSFSSDDVQLGLEYNYQKMVFLRGGYSFTQDDVDESAFLGPSFGAGFRYATGAFNIGFDYAYRFSDKFDANQYFTIALGY